MSNNQIQIMVYQLVDWYAKRLNGVLKLDMRNVPEGDLNKLAAVMLSQDDSLAAEATGPDNPEWEKSMQPALIKTMQDWYGAAMEFNDIWTDGIRKYLMPRIEGMIKELLDRINNEDTECHMSLIWDRTKEKVVELQSRI